jgi:sugar-specific transcriptional regulator TrmB
MSEKITSTLERLGFSPNEIKVYLVLNEHSSLKAGKIAKLAKIDRSSCYNSIKHLKRDLQVMFQLEK